LLGTPLVADITKLASYYEAKQTFRSKSEMSIRPLHDRVVIRRHEEEATSAGGIVLPGSAAEKPNQGEVVAVGPGRVTSNGELQAMSVQVGDVVLFGQYAGNNTVKMNGEELLIMSESEIYGVIES
jgi:chaperonin GroES